jgi:ADP-ribose diphosphatase
MDSRRSRISNRSVVYSTPWFELIAKTVDDAPEPYYCVGTADYVAVVATTAADEFVLVRQYRPALERETLELPSGHVDGAMTPEAAAMQELREETGFETADLCLLGVLDPDTGRMANRMWCFWARDVQPVGAAWRPESGISIDLCPRARLVAHVRAGTFNHALHLAALSLTPGWCGVEPARSTVDDTGGTLR